MITRGLAHMNDGLHEECGVFGIFGDDAIKPAKAAYLALYALQHRGQEACGIAVSDDGVITGHNGLGLVGENFDEDIIDGLTGQMAVGHCRYSTTGDNASFNTQPIIMRHKYGRIAVAHNGNLTNTEVLKQQVSKNGAMFHTTMDSEIIAQLIARERVSTGNIEDAVVRALSGVQGAYSIVVMSPRKMICARDPLGFRPLCIGKIGRSYAVASETCALSAIGASFIRDVMPGEVISFSDDGMKVCKGPSCGKRSVCIFEYIYFARPDSVIDGISVNASREKAGELLAQQMPVDADVVIGVPDSGLNAAIGYARASGIPYGVGFARNNYVGRTFIKPTQSERTTSIGIKLNVLRQCVAGKRVIMIDDSIVRGSTSANIVRALKAAGATEVHVRISSPTIHYPCYFGTDIPTREELTSNKNSVSQLCQLIGADSLCFLSLDSLGKLIGTDSKTYCDACFSGEYPTEIYERNVHYDD